MNLRLILTRHAKSDWDDPLQSDHERPLNPRGREAAPRVGRWLVAEGHLPQEALVSDAVRTRETWALIGGELPQTVPVRFEPLLYHAGPDVMLDVLRSAEAPVVMLVGHNPGIAALAARLVATRPVHPGFGRYPTGATLVVEFEAPDWASVRPGTGVVRDFIVPRELPEG